MKKCIIVFGILILPLLNAIAQNQSVIPPSPVSAEFAKYVKQEVALYNGIPEISIPLYTIQLKGLTIPISLSYHASGIKFAQDDGDLGVGWVINPGYRISRTIYGYADELNPMPSYFSDTLSIYERSGSQEDKLAKDLFLSRFVPNGDFQPNYGQRFDGEFDQFVFSTPSASGGFIISDRINKIVTTTENSNLKIDYKTGQTLCPTSNDAIKGFQIIDDIGNKYAFGEYNPESLCVNETTSNYYGGFVSTAWGLSEINTPLGDLVKFNYVTGSPGKWSNHIRRFSATETNPLNCFLPTITSDPGGTYYFDQGYTAFFSKEIITPNEKIIFNYDPNLGSYKRLINIQVLTSENVLIRTIEFFYTQNAYHTFLDHVTILDSNNVGIQTFQFDYYSKNTSATFTLDHYGYYLETTNNPPLFFHQEFLDDPIWESTQNGESCSYSNKTMADYMGGTTVSREPNPTIAPDYFSLKKITYPMGGYTEYEYEPGSYSDPEVGGQIRKAGIRIKTIKSYDLNNQEPLVRRYSYGNNENGYGIAEFWATYMESLFVSEKIHMDYNLYPAGFAQRVITYSTTMQGDIGLAFSQSGFIKYPCVTEYYDNNIPSGNGKTVCFFNVGYLFDISPLQKSIVVPRAVYSNGSPNYVRRYKLWNKPNLSRKVSYSLSGGQYIPSQEEVFEYDQTSSSFTGLKVDQAATLSPGSVLNTGLYSVISSYFNYGEYIIEVGKNMLKRKLVYNYFNGNTLSNEYRYEYSNLLPSKETIKRSSGDVVVNYSTYPLDYPLGTQFIDDMKNNGLINFPIEKVSCLDKGSSFSILSGVLNTYKIGGKGLFDSKWALENQTPIGLNSFKFSNRSIGILPTSGASTSYAPDANYKNKATYDNYDTKGNITQYHLTDNANTSFCWAYNATQPVVKGENITYDALKAAVESAAGTTDLETYWNGFGSIATNSTQQAAFRTFNTNLRSNAALSNAQVTTYTYTPLVGMTSQTDPNGKTTYYEYDSFGRLKFTKDNNGKILKKFDYHYSTSN